MSPIFGLLVISLSAFSYTQAETPHAQTCSSAAKPFYFALSENGAAQGTGYVNGHGQLMFYDHDEWCKDPVSKLFRTYNGSCNHPKNLGASFQPVSRLLGADYDDRVSVPRVLDHTGEYPLPSARYVSKSLHPDKEVKKGLSVMLMQWGQWLDHDVTGTASASGSDRPIKCCGDKSGNPPFVTNPNCFPIELKAGEPDFVGNCMEFVRSLPARDYYGNEIRPRNQVNTLTSFIDGSNVYGSTNAKAESLRKDYSALLRTKWVNGNEFPPEHPEPSCTTRPKTYDFCFDAGDDRVNEHPGLGGMHTLFVREHNRIARELKTVVPSNTPDEYIWQLARKIVGAEQQVVTYMEYLPIVLGKDMGRYDLWSGVSTARSVYNPSIDPRITSVFGTAAFRFGHSMIPSELQIGSRRVPFRSVFMKPELTIFHLDEVFEWLTGGTKNQASKDRPRAEAMDRNFIDDVTKHLFEPQGKPGEGLDLVALNIQRGRDHGIPPYTKWRSFCGLRPLTGFYDTDALGPNAADFAKLYKSVDDIDLFPALMYEPSETGLGGPTLNCLLGIEFKKLKFGDRFFFNTENQSQGFTDAQLHSLQKTTLAHIICHNTGVKRLPPNVFRLPFGNNALKDCSEIKKEGLDLSTFVSYKYRG